MEAILLGCGLIVALRFTQAYPMVRIPFPREISLLAVRITGVLATLTVVNLAIGGLGLPFAGRAEQKGRHSLALLPMPEPHGILWIAVRHLRRRVAPIAAGVSEVCWNPGEIRRFFQDTGFDQLRAWDATPFFKDNPVIRPACRTVYLARKSRS